jgi:hypothetical protein
MQKSCIFASKSEASIRYAKLQKKIKEAQEKEKMLDVHVKGQVYTFSTTTTTTTPTPANTIPVQSCFTLLLPSVPHPSEDISMEELANLDLDKLTACLSALKALLASSQSTEAPLQA